MIGDPWNDSEAEIDRRYPCDYVSSPCLKAQGSASPGPSEWVLARPGFNVAQRNSSWHYLSSRAPAEVWLTFLGWRAIARLIHKITASFPTKPTQPMTVHPPA